MGGCYNRASCRIVILGNETIYMGIVSWPVALSNLCLLETLLVFSLRYLQGCGGRQGKDVYMLWLVELHGKKAQLQDACLCQYHVLGFLWSATPQCIFLDPRVTRKNIFPENASSLSWVVLAILQNLHELWALSCRTELSAVVIQPSSASFSLQAQNKGCNNIAQNVWKKEWLMLHAQKNNRFRNINSSCKGISWGWMYP